MGAQSGGRRTPRLDMRTDCGPQYVDVQVVALPGPRASYANDLAALEAAVRLQALTAKRTDAGLLLGP
jgi:hypothetical protein